jgi:hypothetical protein
VFVDGRWTVRSLQRWTLGHFAVVKRWEGSVCEMANAW